MEELWKEVLAEIQVEISQPRYVAFFKPTSLVSLEENVATIASQSAMASNLLEKSYYGLLKRVLDKKTGKDVSILFITKRELKAPIKDVGPLFTEKAPSQQKLRPLRIREDYTFDTFAVSDSNQLAYTAASAVAADPGGKYNPLYLYGTVGVGKTHLMHSIANEVFSMKSTAKAIYLTTEEFTNEVVEAIRDKTTTQLRKKFRNLDLLLLDDIQFLSGKEKVQEELFHTFNSLLDRHCQVIFSSDRPPHEIKKLEARLASRFEGGLTVDIEPPDFELRTAILLIKSKKYGLSLTVDLAKQAAEKVTDSRALEGFLLKLTTFLVKEESGEITPQLIDKALGKTKEEKTHVHPDEIIKIVCDYYNIKPTQLKGTKRDAVLVKPRHVCMFLLKEEFGLTLVEIGNLLGGRDHTTIMHAVDKIKDLSANSSTINEEILLIKRRAMEGYLQ